MTETANRAKLPVDVEQFNKLHNEMILWYMTSKPGDWYVYHQGYSLHENLTTEKVRQTAWELACDGKIYLFLKRDPVYKSNFLFMCQRSTKPIKRLIPKR